VSRVPRWLRQVRRRDRQGDGKGKFILAELEEEEHSLERLRRWHRELKARDVFGAPAATEADQQLKHCTERLEDYTERVFAAQHHVVSERNLTLAASALIV
jgi:hypothetical protein